MMDWFLLAVGLVALYFGAEWLVRGASRLAAALGVSPLAIGLTVVGFGTSMPEVVVSVLAAWRGEPAIALGNVVGSNIANTGLILATAALISPLKTNLSLLRREGPIMIGVTLAVWAVGYTGVFARWTGAVMLALLVVFVVMSLRWARTEPQEIADEFAKFEKETRLVGGTMAGDVGWILAGLATLVAGGQALVTSAVEIARRFDVPEAVIAATLVAVGTSLPELATSVVAALRREADISVGNIIGSNMFNLLGVLGLSAAVRPIPVSPDVLRYEMVWMVGFALATVVVLRTGHRISRVEGALLLAAYVVFVVTLFL
ncbi:MAG TPA: calcium/sodium antiporter [Candidatus Acidoferrales bacterium]